MRPTGRNVTRGNPKVEEMLSKARALAKFLDTAGGFTNDIGDKFCSLVVYLFGSDGTPAWCDSIQSPKSIEALIDMLGPEKTIGRMMIKSHRSGNVQFPTPVHVLPFRVRALVEAGTTTFLPPYWKSKLPTQGLAATTEVHLSPLELFWLYAGCSSLRQNSPRAIPKDKDAIVALLKAWASSKLNILLEPLPGTTDPVYVPMFTSSDVSVIPRSPQDVSFVIFVEGLTGTCVRQHFDVAPNVSELSDDSPLFPLSRRVMSMCSEIVNILATGIGGQTNIVVLRGIQRIERGILTLEDGTLLAYLPPPPRMPLLCCLLIPRLYSALCSASMLAEQNRGFSKIFFSFFLSSLHCFGSSTSAIAKSAIWSLYAPFIPYILNCCTLVVRGLAQDFYTRQANEGLRITTVLVRRSLFSAYRDVTATLKGLNAIAPRLSRLVDVETTTCFYMMCEPTLVLPSGDVIQQPSAVLGFAALKEVEGAVGMEAGVGKNVTLSSEALLKAARNGLSISSAEVPKEFEFVKFIRTKFFSSKNPAALPYVEIMRDACGEMTLLIPSITSGLSGQKPDVEDDKSLSNAALSNVSGETGKWKVDPIGDGDVVLSDKEKRNNIRAEVRRARLHTKDFEYENVGLVGGRWRRPAPYDIIPQLIPVSFVVSWCLMKVIRAIGYLLSIFLFLVFLPIPNQLQNFILPIPLYFVRLIRTSPMPDTRIFITRRALYTYAVCIVVALFMWLKYKQNRK